MARRTPLTFVLLVAASIHADDSNHKDQYGSFYTYSYTKVAHAQNYNYPAPYSTVSPLTETFERSTKPPYKPSPVFYAFGTAVEKPWPETTPAPSPYKSLVLGAVETPQEARLGADTRTRVLAPTTEKSATPQAVMAAPLEADRAFEGTRTPPEGAGLGGGQAFQGINAPAAGESGLGGSRAFENVNLPANSGLGGSRAFENLGNPSSLSDLGGGRAFDRTPQDGLGLGGSRAFENVGPSVASAQLQGGQAF